ncbi:MAG: GntR family transcriptional regulator [Acidobacteria bacterium]|nr:GntR family transcriptional regulator [Acidobacteriota bacterium]
MRSFGLSDVRDAIEIRGVFEGTAARFAAERLEDAEELVCLKRLRLEAKMDLPVTVQGFALYMQKNKNFHQEIWRLAKSASLFRELEHVCRIPFAAPEALVFSAADLEESTVFVAAEQHRAILEAIENREGTRAEALAREHSRISRRNLEFALRSENLTTYLPAAALIAN